MVMICPSVMSWAMPRPATISTSVATIGWMLPRETSSPFHSPHRMRRRPAPARITTGSGVLVASVTPPIRVVATAALMAATAPTERSTPPVAITAVMPIAISISGDPRLRMSTRLPKRWPSLISSRKKLGVKKKLKSMTSASATSGQKRPLPRNAETSWRNLSCGASRDGVHDDLLVQFTLAQFGDDGLVAQHENAMAGAQHFLQLGGNEDAAPCLRLPTSAPASESPLWRRCRCRASARPGSGCRVGGQPARQDHLLLVAAAQVLDQLVGRWAC
jgi:hypothetical protein